MSDLPDSTSTSSPLSNTPALARLQTELDEVKRRVLQMGEADQLELAVWLRDFLNLDQPLLDDEQAKRNETLDCLRRAVAHLGLTRPPKVEEYAQAQKALGLTWSWQRIHRLWGSFTLAAAVACGRRMPRTAQQRALFNRYGLARREEPFAALRRWLASKPLRETTRAYDEFAREYNSTLPEDGDELPLPSLATIQRKLALSWHDLLAIAKGERAHEEAVKKKLQAAAKDTSHGEHDLIGLSTVALLAGCSVDDAKSLAQDAYFPRPALLLSNDQRAWLREEVESYLAGERPRLKPANRLRHLYLLTPEVAERLGLKLGSFHAYAGDLEPAGVVGRARYWRKRDVDVYVRKHAALIRRRKQEQAKPGAHKKVARQSDFVTKAALIEELGMTRGQVETLTRQPGFPSAAATFGEARLWLRDDVERYLAGEALTGVEGSRQDELISASEIIETFGWSDKERRAAKLPEPVARLRRGRVWRRAEVVEALGSRVLHQDG